MRKGKELTPTRYRQVKTSGSNKFVSTFKSTPTDGIVEKKDRTYNWLNYKMYLFMTVLIGFITYLVLNYLWF